MISASKQFAIFILIWALCISVISLAGCKKKTEPTVTTNVEVSEQQMCPVMDAPINKELYTEYKGKKVYFCCSGCEGTFLKEPEKYLDKLPQFK